MTPRSIKKQLATLMITAAIGLLMAPLTIQAQDESSSDETGSASETITPATLETFTCEDLRVPERQSGLIITIVEEQVGNIGQQAETIGEGRVLQCIRMSHATYGPDNDNCEGETESCPKKWIWDNDGQPDYMSNGSCTPIQTETEIRICQRIQVFVATSGTGLLFSYLGTIYRWAAGVVGIVTVFYIVWGGIMLTTAGDNTGQVDEAKQKIMQSIAGLVLLFLSAIILYTINPNFFTL